MLINKQTNKIPSEVVRKEKVLYVEIRTGSAETEYWLNQTNRRTASEYPRISTALKNSVNHDVWAYQLHLKSQERCGYHQSFLTSSSLRSSCVQECFEVEIFSRFSPFPVKKTPELTIVSVWIPKHFMDIFNLLVHNHGDQILVLLMENDDVFHWHSICSDSPLEGLTEGWKAWKRIMKNNPNGLLQIQPWSSKWKSCIDYGRHRKRGTHEQTS